MTKPRNSTRRSTNGSKHRGSALATPKRNTATSAACTPKDKGGNSDSGVRDMWDLDAPKFYDFGNSKTPGPKPDKWFDYAHPTPALKNTRLSRLSFSSTDSYESLVPTRLSLSPSRVVMGENGRLTLDSEMVSKICKEQTQSRETEDVPPDAARNEKALDIEKKAARILAKARANNSQQLVRAQPPKRTVPQPFTFRSDAIAERHLMKLREEIAMLKVEEKALRQFRAMPLPDFPTPKKHKREVPQEPMHASPFHLQTNSRGEAYQSQLKARLEELEEKQRERREFKARPIPPSIDQPFVPQPSTIPLTAIEEILLSTELRSEERRAYDDDRMERERIREEVLARKRLEDERREEEEIKRLRKILVHKAQPIRHYKPVDIQPSDRPLTVPKTPQWHIRTRDRSTTTPTPIPAPAPTLDPATPTPMPLN
ncbi:hypothetical protein BX661DRAFT_206730 [Kickxella alabastrina]|uniref:uncharacterized protein n=1 Tax=Kickxella alabastrina TaxID=61397 RepID=UPI002220D610|nr:uncharacterized protein BX661DRAFT_206730 [Kickxella alabastrina]KAI7824203.1 hypothetical protein BX661DRAFT_206730 [Kickxella alabastrina]